MIEEIKLKFGRAEDTEATTLETSPITVFVGPNNSGKSKALQEIQQFCVTGQANAFNVVVESLNFSGINEAEVNRTIEKLMVEAAPGQHVPVEHIVIKHQNASTHVHSERFAEVLKDPYRDMHTFCQIYLREDILFLNANNRINLVNQQPGGNLQQSPKNSFQCLMVDEVKREEVRRIVYEAFGQYLVVDPTNMGHINLRLSKEQPKDIRQEIGFDKEAIEFHAKARRLVELSDGVKAFVGMIIEVIAGDPSVLFIDEPEAFLHPSLAFNLGKEVSRIMQDSGKRLFVSTHSPNFVMGCVQSGAPVNIVRLTYKDEVPTARILPNQDILRLMRNPLLRSTGVISGLFYESVIVTESDTDRAFYQEINERLLKYTDGRGIHNCLFLHAQNKQTLKTIIKPLRELGIPVAGIADIDAIKDGGGVWTSFLDCGFVPEVERTGLADLRTRLNRKFEETGRNMKRDGGISLLQPDDQEGFSNLLEKLADYGLFVLSHGEIESWLPELNVRGHGTGWLVEIFEKMGEDPSSPNYLKPSDGDVWQFMDMVSSWLNNPRRKGIPR